MIIRYILSSMMFFATSTVPSFGDSTPAVAAPPRMPVCGQKYLPPAAVASCAEGTTVLHFQIGTDGRTKEIEIEQSSGNPDIDAGSKACAAEFHYKPAMQNGVPIEVPWRTKIVWSLRGTSCSHNIPTPSGPIQAPSN